MTPSRRFVPIRGPVRSWSVGVVLALGAVLATPSFAQRSFTIQDALGIASVYDPQLSPDGEFVVYVVSRSDLDANKAESRVHGVPFAGGDSAPLTRAGRSASHPRFR